MIIKTLSAWNYGHVINANNRFINFDEGSGELQAEIRIGSYTLGEFADAVATAFNSVGTQVYETTLDRATRKITISATSNFSILASSGSQVNISAFALMGFTQDRTGSNSYEGSEASGDQYIPQYFLQSYVPFENNEAAAQSSINTTATGNIVEVVDFGLQRRMECLIDFVSDGQLGFHARKAQGLLELRNFLQFSRTKGKMEFLPDVNTPNVFNKTILDRTQADSNGTAFRINQNFGRDYYNSGRLTFLEIA